MEIMLQGNYESLLAPRKQALSAAISDLYAVFKNFPLRAIVEGCPHCVFPQDNQRIHSKPLKQLTADDLKKFGWKALTTWGNEDDLRYFLPRLLELLTEPEFVGHVDAPVIAGKLPYGNWHRWPAKQQEAINKFFPAYWNWQLGSYPAPASNADEALCTIANAIDDLSPYLIAWQMDEAPPAASHLAEFIMDIRPKKLKHCELTNGFWHHRKAQTTQVVKWLHSPDLETHVEKLFFTYEKTDPFLAAALSEAASRLTTARNTDSFRS